MFYLLIWLPGCDDTFANGAAASSILFVSGLTDALVCLQTPPDILRKKIQVIIKKAANSVWSFLCRLHFRIENEIFFNKSSGQQFIPFFLNCSNVQFSGSATTSDFTQIPVFSSPVNMLLNLGRFYLTRTSLSSCRCPICKFLSVWKKLQVLKWIFHYTFSDKF